VKIKNVLSAIFSHGVLGNWGIATLSAAKEGVRAIAVLRPAFVKETESQSDV